MVNLKMTAELSTELANHDFERLTRDTYVAMLSDDEYINDAYRRKGIVVIYRNSQYKKKVRLIVRPEKVTASYLVDDALIRKLRKRLRKIFDDRLVLNDFTLTGLSLATDLNVREQDLVEAYMTVLRRVGNVKGFTLNSDCFIGRTPTYLHWQGNSNDTDLILSQSDRTGVIQAEVRLLKNKAIRSFIQNSRNTVEQIMESTGVAETIFREVFSWIVPFGDFCKKQIAVDRIHRDVLSTNARRKMLRLLDLIPKKKSLLLGLKESGCRDPRSLLLDFVNIYLSPVTISKRQKINNLDTIYTYL